MSASESRQQRAGEAVCKAERDCDALGDPAGVDLIREHRDSKDVGDCSLRCFVTDGCNAYVSLWSKKICRLYSKCGSLKECHRSGRLIL